VSPWAAGINPAAAFPVWHTPGRFYHAHVPQTVRSTSTHHHQKPMIHQNFYPSRIADQVTWLTNFKTKIPCKALSSASPAPSSPTPRRTAWGRGHSLVHLLANSVLPSFNLLFFSLLYRDVQVSVGSLGGSQPSRARATLSCRAFLLRLLRADIRQEFGFFANPSNLFSKIFLHIAASHLSKLSARCI